MSEKPTVAEVQRIVDSYFSENIWSGMSKNTLTPHNNPPKRKKRRNRRKP